MENKEKQVRKIAQRVMTKYKLHPPVDMMGLIQEKGITCVEENLGTNADGYSDLKDYKMLFGYPEPGDNFDEPVIEHL